MRFGSVLLVIVGLLMSGLSQPVQALDFDKELSRQEAQVRQVLPSVKGENRSPADESSRLNTTPQVQDREFRVVLLSKKGRR